MKNFTLLFALLSTLTICKAQPIFRWANFATNSNQYGQQWTMGSAVDAAGNMFITGYFYSSIDFNPTQPGTGVLTRTGDWDIYIAKWNAAGNFVWAKMVGGPREDRSNGIGVDAAGNIYIAGFFEDTADFDPGPGVYKMAVSSTAFQDEDAFVLKLDNDGNFVWAKQVFGSYSITNGFTVDPTGNTYSTGFFSGIQDFDPGPGTATMGGPYTSAFVQKLDKDGNYVWAKSFADTTFVSGVDMDAEGQVITVDASQNVYTTGFFKGTIDFDPGPGTQEFTSATNMDYYMVKLDADGNYVWAKQLPWNQTPQRLAADASGNVYNCGSFTGTVDFDPGPGTQAITSAGGGDAYVLKLNATGDYVWAKTIGSPAQEYASKIALDPAGNLYVSGTFYQTVDLDPGPGADSVTTAGDGDIFLEKLDNSGNFTWATTIGNTSFNYPEALVVKGIDDIYLVGSFRGSLNIYPPPGALYLNGSYSGINTFVVHYAATASAPLPLTLLNFDAVDNESNVNLQWQTTNERDIDLFSVERSADGRTFETIGSVTPANNGNLKNDYTSTDLQPLNGTSFYRLKIADRDNTLTYSRIVTIRRQANGKALQIFPNPATDVVNVQINANEPITLEIVDAGGRIWKQQTINLHGNTTLPVDVQALPSGNYFLLMKGSSTQQIKAFLKR